MSETDTKSRALAIIFSLLPFLFLILILPFKYYLRKQERNKNLGKCGNWLYLYFVQEGENKQEHVNLYSSIPYPLDIFGARDYKAFYLLTHKDSEYDRYELLLASICNIYI